jgi:tripartite-type tricarboxylate transporter receptor subunit TctC
MNNQALARFILSLVVLLGLCLLADPGFAQQYPSKSIRFIVASSAGSNADVVARLFTPGLSQLFAQQVIVDNRAGAGTNIAAEVAARAQPDGYTLFQVQQSHTVNASLYRNLRYDLVRDFSPLTQLAFYPQIVVVHPSLQVKSIGELIELARAKPGFLNYASVGSGTTTSLAAELFKLMAAVNIVEVPYRGGGEALTSVVTGETSVYFSPLATALPFVRQKNLRLLAVTSANRLSVLPDTPTIAESGYPGYECGGWYGLMVPAKTANDIQLAIHRATLSVLKDPVLSRRLNDLGYNTVGDQSVEFARYLKSEIEKWGRIVKETGLTAH